MRPSFPRRSRCSSATGLVLVGCLALAVGACAETTASTTAPAAPTAAGAPAKELSWAEMGKQDRIEYMKTVVLPRMRQAFAQFNPDRYEKMNCVTCHDDGATDGSFKMPNPKLPVLPNSSDGFKQLAADKPA